MQDFDLGGRTFIELNKLLKASGLCSSGGQAKMLIANGHVLVDGTIEHRKRCKIYADQVVECDGFEIRVL